ncbi:MAG: hypothetical protein JST14_18970 [Bacteroidetes bacterium]|nr:hypothetical protein [Bacteroidota bacterium]
MKRFLFLLLLVSAACGGKLSNEERKKLHEGMSSQDIKRVTDAELQEAALSYGKRVLEAVEKTDKYLNQKSKIDSIGSAYQVKIYPLIPTGSELAQIEQQLVEAYVSGAQEGVGGENIQKIGTDSILFTKPVFREHPDGSQEFTHAIAIKMAVKTIVLSMPQP